MFEFANAYHMSNLILAMQETLNDKNSDFYKNVCEIADLKKFSGIEISTTSKDTPEVEENALFGDNVQGMGSRNQLAYTCSYIPNVNHRDSTTIFTTEFLFDKESQEFSFNQLIVERTGLEKAAAREANPDLPREVIIRPEELRDSFEHSDQVRRNMLPDLEFEPVYTSIDDIDMAMSCNLFPWEIDEFDKLMDHISTLDKSGVVAKLAKVLPEKAVEAVAPEKASIKDKKELLKDALKLAIKDDPARTDNDKTK